MNQNPNESTVPFAEAAQLPDEFELLERLGEGGHGTVYKARFKLLDRIVAVKIIKSDASDDMRKQIERMQHEAKALAKLSHQNIVKVFQVGTCTDGRPFLVCEYLEGKTLEKFLLESKVLNKDQIKQIFPQILSALHYAHENNLVHRDIKPGNILLLEDAETKTLTVKLLDFGIAREIELPSESTPGLTRTSLLSGSPAYMSPEQCQGQKLDRRSDLYSTACIMYECLYGSAPFSGESELAIQYKHIHDPADSLEHIARESDLKLRQILIKSLAKDPGKRQQSAEQFKDELLKWLGDVKVTDPLINPHSLALAAFVILLILAGTFVFNLMQSARKKQASSEIAILTEPVKKRRPRVARQSDISTLHSIVAEYYDQTSDEQYYDIKPDFRELIPELDKVIEHQLKKPSKTSKALIYFAYFWKARLQFTQRGFSIAERRDTVLSALKNCQRNGKPCVESIYAQTLLAQIYCEEKKFAEEEKLLHEIKAVRERVRDINANLNRLGLPDPLEGDLRDSSRPEDTLKLIGINAFRQKNYPKAIEYYDLYTAEMTKGAASLAPTFTSQPQIFERSKHQGGSGTSESAKAPVQILKADLLARLGKKKEAVELAQSLVPMVVDDVVDTPHRKFWQEESFREIAKWQYLNDEKADSLNTLTLALKEISERKIQAQRVVNEMKEAYKLLEQGKPVAEWEKSRSIPATDWNLVRE